MNNSILEITANNYYIKLNKTDVNLVLLRKLLDFLKTENLNKDFETNESDIISRYHDNYEGEFDRLDDK